MLVEQLLGEIARGHWGLCKASVAEVIAPPAERWNALHGRLVFAPETEMMEDFIRRGVAQMEREAVLNARSGALDLANSEPSSPRGETQGAGEASASTRAADNDVRTVDEARGAS